MSKPEKCLYNGDRATATSEFCWSNFCKFVFYGYARWPSYSYWMVPGTVTDVERAGWLP